MEDKVSVIVPCYNYGRFLPEAIASVMAQTYPRWECIIVDDGSTDQTRQVAADLCRQDRRITYVYQPNRGAATARNTGITRSNGAFVQFLDADDLLEADKLRCQARFLAENPQVDIVYGGARMFSGGPGERVVAPGNIQELDASGAGPALVNDFLHGKLPLMSAPLFRRSMLEGVGLFIEAIKASEDYEFWLRCALADKSFRFLPGNNTGTLIRKGHQSLSGNVYKMFIGTVLAHRALLGQTGGKHKALLEKRQEELVRVYGEQLYKAAVFVDFRKHGWELLRAAVLVKHPFVSRMVAAAARDKTKQLLSSVRRNVLKTGKA